MILVLRDGSDGGDKKCILKCDECGKVYQKTHIQAIRGKRNYCSIECRRISEKKDIRNRPAWKGGTSKMLGYVFEKVHNHPKANDAGYVKRSRLIMEEYLGRYLTDEECIHHINSDRSDDRIENLMLFPDKKSHMKYHHKLSHKYPLIEGLYIQELAEFFNVSRQSIWKWMHNPSKIAWMKEQVKEKQLCLVERT